MGDPGRARHRLPRPGGPSPGQEGAAWCGRPHPPHPRTARRRDERPDLGPGERNGPPPAPGAPPRAGRVVRPPPQPLGKGHEREHQPPRAPLPAQRHPHHQPPTPARAPSPTNRATAPAPPSTTPPHKRHSPNSLPPPLDTTHSQPQPCPRRTVASACAVEPTASEAPAPCPPRGRDGAGAQRLERSVRAVRPRCQQSSGQTHGHAARRRGSRDQWTAPAAACPVVGGLAHLEADTRTLRVADTSGCRLTFTV